MLFSEDSDLDLLLASIGTCAILAFALKPVVEQLGVPSGPLVALAAGFPTLINLIRYKRARWGCAVVPLGLVAWGGAFLAGASPLVQALALLIPNLPFYLFVTVAVPVLARQRAAQALSEIANTSDPAALAPHLGAPDPLVRQAAGEALGRLGWGQVSGHLGAPLAGEDLGARQASADAIRAQAGGPERAAVLAWLEAEARRPAAGIPAAGLLGELSPDRACALLERAGRDPSLVLAVADGLLHGRRLDPEGPLDPAEADQGGDPHLAVPLLVEVLTRSAEADLRGDAFLLAARFAAEDPHLAQELACALREETGSPSSEELALVGEVGSAGDVLRVSAYVGAEDYDLAAVALEACEAIARRVEDDFGPARAPLLAALRTGATAIRARHPVGENRLADQLVARLEVMLAGLGEG